MYLKDYYSILELPPSATPEEIKKAYRRLAQQYHPDKQQGDAYSTAQFSIIKEAYETLINPARKENYLQQRWYAKSAGKKGDTLARSPVAVLQQLLELDRYTSRLDTYRLDTHGLADYFGEIYSGENIDLINTFRDDSVTDEIITVSLRIIRLLPPRMAVRPYHMLLKLAPVERYENMIETHRIAGLRRERWEKKKIWLLLVLVAAICMLIIFIT